MGKMILRVVLYLKFISNFFKNLLKLLVDLCRFDNLYLRRSISTFRCNIEKDVKIYSPAGLTDVSIGKGSYIGPNSSINNAAIGKFCSIGPNFFCGWGIHPIDGISTSPAFYSTRRPGSLSFCYKDKFTERKRISIGNDVFIGANVTVLDGVNIGDGAVIGAGAVVSKDVPCYGIAVGNPAKVTRFRFGQETISRLTRSKWWEGDTALLMDVEKHFFDVEAFLDHVESLKGSRSD